MVQYERSLSVLWRKIESWPFIARGSGSQLLFLLALLTLLISAPNQATIAQADIAPLQLVWSSTETDHTDSVAWGDVDGDGDLDQVAANRYQVRLYRNDGDALTTSAVWSSIDGGGDSIAWGDFDDDGDLDIAVGDTVAIRIYRNDSGVLNDSATWSSADGGGSSVAWGDADKDGDLDLGAADSQAVRFYRNNRGALTVNPVWSSIDGGGNSIAWGDYDGDTHIDLAVAGDTIRLYHNSRGALTTRAAWSSSDGGGDFIAWGDVDGDNDLDLAAASSGPRLYRNDNGTLTSNTIWSPVDGLSAQSVAWGDMEGDGDLDLAVGNGWGFEGTPNQLYRNDGGTLTTSAIWTSADLGITRSVAWGDVDSDGDLDLLAGNNEGSNRLYRNDSAMLSSTFAWSSSESLFADELAWGDVDGDGDLDLAVAASSYDGQCLLYRNINGVLSGNAVWTASEVDDAESIAWGDVDSDGDLDLAVGLDYIRLYRNNGGWLTSSAVWISSGNNRSNSLAWGDVDGDGDLDLAVGNIGDSNRLFRNDGGILTSPAAWSSEEADDTYSVAWGDVDNDGDLDLAVGNSGQSNRLYRNNGGALSTIAVWSSVEVDQSTSVGWSDVDGDGDLDLGVANIVQANRLYLNDQGMLTPSAAWSSGDVNWTNDLSWGDADGDGDFDLAVANDDEEHSRVYRNDGGELGEIAVWTSPLNYIANSVAWGDVDNDGDLDLAQAHVDAMIRLHPNITRGSSATLFNAPPTVSISRPGITDDAGFFSTPEIIKASHVPINYVLYDPERGLVPKIFPEYSPNGGGQWFAASAGPGGDGLIDLLATPEGTAHIFVWNANADLIRSDNVVFRISAQPNQRYSPILWPAQGSQSYSFRVAAAPWFAKVVDEDGQSVAGAIVYYNGELVATNDGVPALSDRAGLLRLDRAATGQPIVALLQVDERNTKRAAHEEWAYRTYVTSLNLSSDGLPRPDRTGQPGEQRVTVRRDDALVLFNIVVSIEWDADKGYLHMVEDAFRKASDMLYDVTDGQMAFGQVSIYDNGKHWADADFQISTKNTVRPYAFISGLTSDDTAHSIRVGRFWNGDSGSQGNWDEPTGYRTLVHEFGHYALNLHDEYFVRTVDVQGHFTGEAPAACTGLEVIDNDKEAVNASMMYYQYNASELAGNDRWNVNCQYTEQARIHGESDWATVVRHYMDNIDRPRWELNTPSSRGSIMAGPATFPTYLLPFPKIDVKDFGQGGAPRQLTVYDPSGTPLPNALVALYTTPDAYTIAIDQGLTGQQGNLTVYGAAEKDTIQVASFNGAYAGATTVDKRLAYELTLSSTSANRLRIGSDNNTPYLSLVPGSEGDSLFMEVQGALAGSLPLNAIVIPGQGGGDPQSTSLAYSPAKGAYSGHVSFAGVGLGSGEVRVSGVTGGQWISINSNYNLMQVENRKRNELASEDGNLQLFVGANSLFSSADAYAVVLPTGYVPGPLPEEKQILGSAYEVRFSGATTGLKKPGVLRMHFHPEVVGKVTELAIYRWDPANKVWRQVGGAQNEIDDAVTAPVKKFGIYALMGKRIISDTELFFPVLFRP